MTLTPIKIPVFVKKMFPNYVWDIKTTQKVIYLTFDDGPTPEVTRWTLNTLKGFNAKATFFCIGSNIKQYPDIFQDILNEGHSIGNHTLNHVRGWTTRTKKYIEEVNKTQDIINTETAKNTTKNHSKLKLFRPPFGKIKSKQAKTLQNQGYDIIMWDILSFDWKENITPEYCANSAINKTSKGSIIVFHDSVKASKNMQYALPKLLETFTKKGYTFEALTPSCLL